jgi:hypothetical protein
MQSVLRLSAIILVSTILASAQSIRSQGPVSTPPPSQTTHKAHKAQHHSTTHAHTRKARRKSSAASSHRKAAPPATTRPEPQEEIINPLGGKTPALHKASVSSQAEQPIQAARISPAAFAATGLATLALGLLGRPYRAFQRARDRANEQQQ